MKTTLSTLEGALALFHVTAGAAALVLGPIALWAPKRVGLHSRMGDLYFAMVTAVCASAVVLAGLRWAESAFFLPIAVGTYAFALPGYLAAKRRWRGWLLMHVIGQTSSYVALVTAFIVNNIQAIAGVHGVPFAVRALVPMFLGTCVVAWVAYQVYLGKRPKL